MSAHSIARLNITLDGVEPPVRRRIEVPLSIRLDRLHLVFQAAMGWTNSHLYEIRAGGAGWGEKMPDAGDNMRDAARARLGDVIADAGTDALTYLYDFGDGWEHSVKLECIVDALPGVLYPILIAADGHCPPEDCGGPSGYADLLEALSDPTHERHAEMAEWAGTPLNPALPAIGLHQRAVEALARKWASKRVRNKKSAE